MGYALVTGATSGIGIAVSRVLARKGYGIVMVSSSLRNLKKAQKSMEQRFPKSRVCIIVEDLSIKDAARNLYNKIHEKGIDIDILVNNAGFGLIGGTEKIDVYMDEKLLYLNIITPTILCKLFLKDMYKKGRGRILNVASTAAFQPGPYNSTYFASKSYLYSYSRAVRYEAMEHGVDVCTLCPGSTRTKFFKKEGLKTPLWAMPAGKVAEYAVDGLFKNKAVIVPGRINRIIKAVPSGIKLAVIASMKKQKRHCI